MVAFKVGMVRAVTTALMFSYWKLYQSTQLTPLPKSHRSLHNITGNKMTPSSCAYTLHSHTF